MGGQNEPGQKFALLSFLLINVAVLALDYFQVKEFIRRSAIITRYRISLQSAAFFPQPFLSEMVDACFGTGDRVRPKSRFDPTVFIKYTVADTVLFGVIAGVISAFEKKISLFSKQRDYGYRNRGMLFTLFNPRLPNPIYQPIMPKAKSLF